MVLWSINFAGTSFPRGSQAKNMFGAVVVVAAVLHLLHRAIDEFAADSHREQARVREFHSHVREVPSSSPTRPTQKKEKTKEHKDEESPVEHPLHSQLAAWPNSSKTSTETSSSSDESCFGHASDSETHDECIWVQKDKSSVYEIPENVECLIKQNKVPQVLLKPLTTSTYKDYFSTLLYAEDYYLEKWSDFKFDVALELKQATVYGKSRTTTDSVHSKDNKIFVSFEVDAVPEKLPFLLTRDFVFTRPSNGPSDQTFQGRIYRVEKKSNDILVEFGQDFFSQHRPTSKYDVSFSFNRVCLKRFHQAIEVASNRSSLRGFIFPDSISVTKTSTPISASTQMFNRTLDKQQRMAVHKILSHHQGPVPYLVQGQLALKKDTSTTPKQQLTSTGSIVKEAVAQLYHGSRNHRILVCAPVNRTCDVLMECLEDEIWDGDMFRANAAYREMDGIPSEVLSRSTYKGDCFTCPPLHDLESFRVILSTYVTSFRLHSEGIDRGHFTHIFLVDASMAIEPEAMVPVSNLAAEQTSVVVTGSEAGSPGLVRSDIARKYGLMTSYFERLKNSSKLYCNGNAGSMFISRLEED